MIRVPPTSQEALEELFTNGVSKTRKSKGTNVTLQAIEANKQFLHELEREQPASPINGFAPLVNFSSTSDEPIHRWFRYREGFSLELVKHFAKGLPNGAVILDPFCGAGTTLIAAQQMGYSSIGIDVSPLSTLVSKVKSTPLGKRDWIKLHEAISEIKCLTPADTPDEKPGLNIIDKVFDAEILHALLVVRHYIHKLDNERVRDFLFVAWLAILEQVSNVYREGNGIKYKTRKRTEDGYIKVNTMEWQNAMFPADRFSFVRERYLARLSMMQDDSKGITAKLPDVKIVNDTATNISSHLQDNSISLTIFSPPYCNCFNYFKAYKIEMWMGGFISSYAELREQAQRALRSHVEMPLVKEGDLLVEEVEQYVRLLENVTLWSNQIPNAIRGYFMDMRSTLQEVFRVLRPSGKCVIVVGNSSYGGIVIPTDALLANIAKSIGFRVEKISVARYLTPSSQQQAKVADRKDYLRESIVILEKQDPRLLDQQLVIVDEIPLDDNKRINHVFAIKNSGLTYQTHKFHRYPGKFIPHVPRWAIRNYLNANENPTVLDPFCGSGTTLVESALNGISSYGADIDPIARLISQVKSTAIEEQHLLSISSAVAKDIRRKRSSKFRPEIPTLAHWFSNQACQELGVIREVIDQYKSDEKVYKFLLVCFASIIRRASNADNQTQKTYVSHTLIKTPESAKELFLLTLSDYTSRLIAFGRSTTGCLATILPIHDSRQLGQYWGENSLPKVDLVVTSPPYLNSVDYVYNQMAEYFWIGDLFGIQTQALQNKHKCDYIGTDRVFASDYKEYLAVGVESADKVSRRIFQKNKKNSYVVSKYFLDMQTHMKQVHSVLKDRAHYICVIGDSLVSGESILVHEILKDCAEHLGFRSSGDFGYEIRNRHMRFPRNGRGGIVRYDWVLDFVKE